VRISAVGNLMLADDGRVIFLDFGLMSVVDSQIMEAFASGIQAALSEDWVALAQAFKDTGFVNDPVQYRSEPSGPFTPVGVDAATGEDLGLARFSRELEDAMRRTEGGSSRFGALATVLNQELAPRWKMFTPPYILLLIRTFLTLEGIAGRVDPGFNIYEMAMPWAMHRSLSPESAEGVAALRSTLLTPDSRVQWERLLQLVAEAQAAQRDGKAEAEEGLPAAPPTASASNEAARAAAMNDAVGSLLGSRPGLALRRLLSELDSTDLAARLVSPAGRPLRHAAAFALSDALAARRLAARGSAFEAGGGGAESRPVSEAAQRLRRRREARRSKVLALLVRSHLSRQLRRGPKGVLALASFAYLVVRVAAGALCQPLLRSFRKRLQWSSSADPAGMQGQAPATAPAHAV